MVKTNSATEDEEEAGVFIIFIPFFGSYSTSMLSIPTPPLPIIFKLGHLSINLFLLSLQPKRRISISFLFMKSSTFLVNFSV